MTKAELLVFLRSHRLAVVASVDPAGAPAAAVVGFGVSDKFEVIFDTLSTTRKATNWRSNNKAAAVIGWDDEVTVQINGIADEPQREELGPLTEVYFTAWPECRTHQAWANITYFRIRPTWLRLSDYRPDGHGITEWTAAELAI